jgi:hypothetical protein
MTLRTTGFLAAVLVAAVPCALAQGAAEKKAPEIPKPAPEMAGLAYFEGSWTCEGTMQPSPGAPAGKMTSTAMIHNDLGGFWQSGRIKGTTAGMPPFEGMFHTTYDPAAKQYVMIWVDNMGAWSRSASKGWEGDKIVYEGEMQMGGQKLLGRDTFTKGAGGSMRHTAEMQVDGKWTPMGDETCRKAPK